MDGIPSDLDVMAPRSSWSRRGFVMTSLVTGFAISMQPVSAETITTDTAGLEAGEVIYPEAPHGFNADYRPSYRADDAKDGWNQMLACFKKNGVA
jgi:carboxymethylenebutenolidase